MVKLKLVDCKESVQQWCAVGIDVKINAIFDRIEGKQALNQSLGETGVAAKNQTFSCGQDWTFDDYAYPTVQIGDQCWFSENLRTTVYADGSSIPEVTDNRTWPGLSTGARCDYDNDASNVATYGRLYNWHAATDAAELCPSGWHVPTDGEWMVLEMELGMSESEANSTGWRGTDEGTQLKSTYGWLNAGNGTDDFGFSALPGGNRSSSFGSFSLAGSRGYWWSSSPSGGAAWSRGLSYANPDVYRRRRFTSGFSVRCLRDAD
ncbi:MAG: fibrobacter succinogenes major paralogous domain-containing protein [Flavobacteriales bacterium]|nr:fibrobacter succinogenes major paralogous domain-containing protein [Flavobacteriales bacterium]